MDKREPSDTANPEELITITEFCRRLKVSRSTVYCWMKERKIRIGEHYIRVHRTLRFMWSREILLSMGGRREDGVGPRV